jgi:flagellar assembly factor FliW
MILNLPSLLAPHAATSTIHLPDGLKGLSDLKDFDILYSENQLPFMWLQSQSEEGFSFLIIDPKECVSNYVLEISNVDTAFLEIENMDDVLIFNIVTIPQNDNDPMTVNLIAPIVIHRKTGKGRQVILENFKDYSTHYPLSPTTPLVAVAR